MHRSHRNEPLPLLSLHRLHTLLPILYIPISTALSLSLSLAGNDCCHALCPSPFYTLHYTTTTKNRIGEAAPVGYIAAKPLARSVTLKSFAGVSKVCSDGSLFPLYTTRIYIHTHAADTRRRRQVYSNEAKSAQAPRERRQ